MPGRREGALMNAIRSYMYLRSAVGASLTLFLAFGSLMLRPELSIANRTPASANPISEDERQHRSSASIDSLHALGLEQLKLAEHALATDDEQGLAKLRSTLLDKPGVTSPSETAIHR